MVQRVSSASVTVDGEVVGAIGFGLCALIGVAQGDGAADVESVAEKVVGLRVFEDESGRMNRSLLEVGGRLLAVSQFTLLGDVRRGKRPSFSTAMEPEGANVLFQEFCSACRRLGAEVETGRFRAEMQVALVNTGPVTVLIDSRKLF